MDARTGSTEDEYARILEISRRPCEPLVDEQGPIPTFPPAQLDEDGQLIPISDEEHRARLDAFRRTLEVMRNRPDNDPPGTDEEVMRAIDSHRPPGQKLFEGYY